MILVVAAMDEEYQELAKMLENERVLCCKGIKCHQGKIDNKDVMLMLSGVGKVNAAYSLSTIMNNFEIDFVINIGSAGGINSKDYNIKPLDIVIAQKVCQHDVDLTLAHRLPGVLPDLPQYYHASLDTSMLADLKDSDLTYHVGTIASGDQFVGDLEIVKKIQHSFEDVCAVEMEAGAIAQICYILKVPFVIFRSISDVINEHSDNQVQFEEYIKQASINSARSACLVIKSI
ncbi:MAG: 5'-methylthioadenosine/adenosylhomocysteine nucleosidase [Bacilli bacterium]|jgi:adenosylhomocysteine nucleosidase|nr:5'-methylthioadenosine/adenosylhomocysteine nucleosidase [Bacilli bacterium]